MRMEYNTMNVMHLGTEILPPLRGLMSPSTIICRA